MYITREKLEEIKEKHSTLIIVNSDVIGAMRFVQEVLEAEADALKEREPTAATTIDRLNAAAYEIFDLCGDIDREEFGKE